jgi:hypothetical protein
MFKFIWKRFDVFNRLRNCMRLFHTHCYNTLSLWHTILDVHNLVLRFLSWNPCKQKMILLKKSNVEYTARRCWWELFDTHYVKAWIYMLKLFLYIPRILFYFNFIFQFWNPIVCVFWWRRFVQQAGATTNHLNDIDRHPLCEYIYSILGVFIRKNHLHKIWMHYTHRAAHSRHIKLVDGRRGI